MSVPTLRTLIEAIEIAADAFPPGSGDCTDELNAAIAAADALEAERDRLRERVRELEAEVESPGATSFDSPNWLGRRRKRPGGDP